MKVYTFKKIYTEVTDFDSVINDFLPFDLYEDWDGTLDTFKEYLEENYDDVTEEDLEKLISMLKTRYDKEVKEETSVELEQLSNRKNIKDWLADLIDQPYLGDVGFLLTTDEIIDLIIQNGNKI